MIVNQFTHWVQHWNRQAKHYDKKLIRYPCFISVDFIHTCSCHHRPKKSKCYLGEKQISVNQCDLLAINLHVPLHLQFLTGLNMSSWSFFSPRVTAFSFENSPSFQISWTYSDVFQINEKFIHHCLPCLLAEMAKVASSVARPRKCEYNVI